MLEFVMCEPLGERNMPIAFCVGASSSPDLCTNVPVAVCFPQSLLPQMSALVPLGARITTPTANLHVPDTVMRMPKSASWLLHQQTMAIPLQLPSCTASGSPKFNTAHHGSLLRVAGVVLIHTTSSAASPIPPGSTIATTPTLTPHADGHDEAVAVSMVCSVWDQLCPGNSRCGADTEHSRVQNMHHTHTPNAL